MSVYSFQLTRPRKARRLCIYHLSVPSWNFNSRAHARRDENCLTASPRIPNFNSRAHARRDCKRRTRKSNRDISTHAPTQGATGSDAFSFMRSSFQLTRPRKARRLCIYHLSVPSWNFNSRAHARRDSSRSPYGSHNLKISTHAPTQGATRTCYP